MPTADQFPVKWMHSHMPRAPMLSAQAGSYIAVLDAFLLTGWGAMTPQRVSVEGGVATVTCNVGDTFEPHMVIEVAGAEQPELNGLHRVLASMATSFTFATDAADGYATGTISIKAAAAGWEKVFAGENRAVYRSRSLRSSGVCFLVDDTEDHYAQVRGYTSMSSIDEGLGPFPSVEPALFWKSWTTGAGALRYDFFADAMFAVCAVAASAGSLNAAIDVEPLCFGEPLVSPLPPDPYAACVIGAAAQQHQCGGVAGAESSIGTYMRAAFAAAAGGGASVSAEPRPYGTPQGNAYKSGLCEKFGSPADGRPLVLGRQALHQGDIWRAFVPGLYVCPQKNVAALVEKRDTVRAAIGGETRVFIAQHINCWGYRNAATVAMYRGVFFVDITGPWREE